MKCKKIDFAKIVNFLFLAKFKNVYESIFAADYKYANYISLALSVHYRLLKLSKILRNFGARAEILETNEFSADNLSVSTEKLPSENDAAI